MINLDKLLKKNAAENGRLNKSLAENEKRLRSLLSGCDDILFKSSMLSGINALFVCTDSMYSSLTSSIEVLGPILSSGFLPENSLTLIDYIALHTASDMEQKRLYSFNDVVLGILSGCVVLLVDGSDCCLCFGAQGFPKRAVSDAVSEVDELSAHEAFSESFKDNVALIRKRLHTHGLKISYLQIGTLSKTTVCVCYIDGIADAALVSSVKEKLGCIRVKALSGAGTVSEFLESGFHVFSSIGTTERPDTACAEMVEGRVVIITDGTPYAVIVPFLFSENFSTVDDYNLRPAYALTARIIKYLAFFISVLLPGIYVSLCAFHQEALPEAMLYDIAVQESITPFPVMLETLFIHFVYEIVREAGVRMPRTVGSAVSIVGGLVIGEAAVSAGLISAPMLIVVALSAITGFVVPKLYRNIALLRFSLIIISGFSGFYGITLFMCCVVCDMCRTGFMGIPITAPFSPFSLKSMRDTVIRRNWKKLSRSSFNIQQMER